MIGVRDREGNDYWDVYITSSAKDYRSHLNPFIHLGFGFYYFCGKGKENIIYAAHRYYKNLQIISVDIEIAYTRSIFGLYRKVK